MCMYTHVATWGREREMETKNGDQENRNGYFDLITWKMFLFSANPRLFFKKI